MKTFFRHIFFAGTAAVVLSFAACAETEKFLRVSPSVAEVSASDSLNFSAVFDVEASTKSWMVNYKAKPDWVEEYIYNINLGTLTAVAVGQNSSLAPRSVEIEFSSGDGLTQWATFTQLGLGARLDVDLAGLRPLDGRGDSLALAVNDDFNENWSVMSKGSGGGWLSASRYDVTSDSRVLVLKAPSSRSLDPRRDTVMLSSASEEFLSLADTIAVVQNGVDLLVLSGSITEPDPTIRIPAEGTTTQGAVLDVLSRNGWTVEVAEDPESRVVLGASGGEGDMGDGEILTMNVAASTSEEEYRFELVFESAGLEYKYYGVQAGATTE